MARIKKTHKDKPIYGILSNFKYITGLVYGIRKRLIFFILAGIPIASTNSMLTSFIYSMIIALITEGDPLHFSVLFVLLKLTSVLINSLAPILSRAVNVECFHLNQTLMEMVNRKTMSVGYEFLESKDGQEKRALAMGNINTDDVVYNHSGVRGFIENTSSLISNVLGIGAMSAVILTLDPVILLILCTATVIPYIITNAVMSDEHRHREEWSVFGRKMNYIGYTLADWSKTKDIRLNGMKDLFEKLVWDVIRSMLRWRGKYQRKYFFGVDMVEALFKVLLNAVAYWILVSRVLSGDMTPAVFTFYFSVITGFSSWLSSLLDSVSNVRRSSLAMCDLRSYLEIDEDGSSGITVPDSETYEIVFDNVCYRYNGADNDTLNCISFTIRKGEKIALVGLNGAGKTTLVKLLCGLLTPSSGKILLGGSDISLAGRRELYKIYSAVFQDIFLLPLSVRQNVSMKPDSVSDGERVQEVIRLAGLEKRINDMSAGMDTLLVKSVREGADEMSGGEKQKLALARALYKDGGLLILDEPTAALDPLAESRMYHNYNDFSSGRTSVFISHRLSSTRFCDRILMLEDGRIVQSGSHEELMRTGGAYSKLYDIQAHYYREGGEAVEPSEA